MDERIFTCCSMFHAASGIPLMICTMDGKYIKSYPETTMRPYIPPYPINLEHKNPNTHLLYESHAFYGSIVLNQQEGLVFVGPVFHLPVNENMVRAVMREHAVPLEYKEEFTALLRSVPNMPYEQYLKNLTFLHYCLNGEVISTETHFHLFDDTQTLEIRQKHAETVLESKETETLHNTYYWEQELYHLLQEGDTRKLKDFLTHSAENYPLNEGMMADTPLRKSKNNFIGTATKVGMLAGIPGGLDVEEVYQLIDTYTLECEKVITSEDIVRLYYSMLMDFCERLSDKQIPKGISPEVHLCMTYIRSHTNEPIGIPDVADHIHRSNSYIINRFKQELGINIGAFITRCKLEEAKSLLTYTDRSLAEISSYLCFSSQSYFQNVFKKKYGMTPMQFRKQRKV